MLKLLQGANMLTGIDKNVTFGLLLSEALLRIWAGYPFFWSLRWTQTFVSNLKFLRFVIVAEIWWGQVWALTGTISRQERKFNTDRDRDRDLCRMEFLCSCCLSNWDQLHSCRLKLRRKKLLLYRSNYVQISLVCGCLNWLNLRDHSNYSRQFSRWLYKILLLLLFLIKT